MRRLWDLIAIFVSMIFSIVHWFNWLAETPYSIGGILNTGIVWLIGVAFIGIAPKFIGWVLDFFDAYLEGEVQKMKAAK